MQKKIVLVAIATLSTMILSSCGFSLAIDSPQTGSSSSNSFTSDSSSSSSVASSSSEEHHSVPEYRGMTIQKTLEASENATLDFSYATQQGYSAQGTEDLDDLVDYPVEQDDEVKYFVQPGEWFYLNIYLSNPDAYEIQSFTLNEQKYANYMFEEGSTLTKIVLHLQAPMDPGYFTFHIQGMKYLDHNEIRDVIMNNDTTIQVGIPYEDQPTCASEVQVFSDGAKFDLDVQDPDHLSKDYPIYFYLSDGNSILKRQELKIGQNNVNVQGLNVLETYQYGIITAFDKADGKYDHSEWLVKETFTTKPPISLGYLKTTESAVEFSVNADADYQTKVTKIELWNGVDIKETIQPSLGQSIFSFENLLSNHSYSLNIFYDYVMDGEASSDVMNIDFHTETAKEPQVSFEVYDKSQTSLSFKLDVIDEDNVFRLKAVVLSDETGVLESVTERKDIYTFENLLSGHTYFIKASYYYDLNDETGDKLSETGSVSATTLSFQAPDIDEAGILLDDDRIQASYRLIGDCEGQIDSLTLRKNGAEIQTVSGDVAGFTGLDSETEYEVLVRYSYDLNDGLGTRKATRSFFYQTYPKMEVVDFRIENEEVIQPGETLFFSIYLENQRELPITKAVINGKTLAVDPLSSPEKVLLQVVNDGSLGKGNVTFDLQGLYFIKDGVEQYLTTDLTSKTFFLNGTLQLLKAAIVDSDNVERTYAYPGEDLYVYLTFENDLDFELQSIDGVPVLDLPIEKIDDSHYRYRLPQGETGSNRVEIKEITYGNAYLTDTIQASLDFSYVRLASDTPVDIDSAEDLADLDGYQYYRLTKDIDLSGTNFAGTEMKGYFDGNGHTISNMKAMKNIENGNNVALFTKATGGIANLKLENFFFSVGFNDNLVSSTRTGVAFLVGESKDLSIKNCSIDGQSKLLFSSQNVRGNNCGVGGFVGIAYSSLNIENSLQQGNISGKKYIGGFVGFAVENEVPYTVRIRQCENDGMVVGTNYYGGFVGSAEYYGTIRLENVLNRGNIVQRGTDSYISQGAFVGNAYYSTECSLVNGINLGETETLMGRTDNRFFITDSVNLCSESRLSDTIGSTSGQNGVEVVNSYSLNTTDDAYNITEEKAMDLSFYDGLHFEKNLWSFEINEFNDERTLVIGLKTVSF